MAQNYLSIEIMGKLKVLLNRSELSRLMNFALVVNIIFLEIV
jgi:hypothetical protein